MGNIAEWSERRPQVEAATHLSVRISPGLQTEAENTSSVRNSQTEDHTYLKLNTNHNIINKKGTSISCVTPKNDN